MTIKPIVDNFNHIVMNSKKELTRRRAIAQLKKRRDIETSKLLYKFPLLDLYLFYFLILYTLLLPLLNLLLFCYFLDSPLICYFFLLLFPGWNPPIFTFQHVLLLFFILDHLFIYYLILFLFLILNYPLLCSLVQLSIFVLDCPLFYRLVQDPPIFCHLLLYAL